MGFFGRYFSGGESAGSGSISLTTGQLITRDGQGNAQPNVTLTFALQDSGQTTDSFDATNFEATSDDSGTLAVQLIAGGSYGAKRARGKWVYFIAGSGSRFALPEILSNPGMS